ncbi:MAG: hypothetical protein EXR98_17080 [Gemmataceae bacterium]|nr:hypothetical protein [Gemmataceae bacterium]
MPEEKPPVPAPSSDGAVASGSPPCVPLPAGAVSTEPMNLPPISLGASAPKPAPTPPPKNEEPKDSFREFIETIVFVVVLVLMLKTFLAEAFVIPTGSMANTLLGYHYKVTCDQCGYTNWVNASAEAEPPPHLRRVDPKDQPKIVRCQCVICKHMQVLPGREDNVKEEGR